MTQKYNDLVVANKQTFLDFMDEPYGDKAGVAYLQWSSGYVTSRYMPGNPPSVTKVVSTVKGYPEISYFVAEVVTKNLTGSKYAAQFKDIAFIGDIKNKNGTEYQYLWSMGN